MAKFLIVSNQPVTDSMAVTLANIGVLNVAVIYLNSKSEVTLRNFDKFKMKTFISRLSISRNLSVKLFPDKLKNFDDYTDIRLAIPEQKVPPMVNTPQLNTYDMSGYCTYIPIKPKRGFFRGLLFKVSDGSTKVVFLSSIGATMLVLRLYKVKDSTCFK